MNELRNGRIGAAVAAGLMALAAAASAGPAQDAELARGEQVARRQCWACHVVARDQELKPMLRTPTPSFFEIADRPGTTVQGLRAFLATTHWDMKTVPIRMPEPLLTPEQTAAVARYIVSLRAPERPAPAAAPGR